MKTFLTRTDTILLTLGSLILGIGTVVGWFPFSNTEAFAFISGAICVWLVVLESAWNWGVGVLNNILFIYLFLGAKLYADAWLQVLYIALAVFGTVVWLWGRRVVSKPVDVGVDFRTGSVTIQPQVSKRVPKPVTRVGAFEAVAVLAASTLFTYWVHGHLVHIGDIAPVRDAITTGLSLGATWGQCRKLLESWVLWILADCIYVPLYFQKGLTLTALLYVIFLLMCFAGYREWRRRLCKPDDLVSKSYVDRGKTSDQGVVTLVLPETFVDTSKKPKPLGEV